VTLTSTRRRARAVFCLLQELRVIGRTRWPGVQATRRLDAAMKIVA
jgi:hypothetical protein